MNQPDKGIDLEPLGPKSRRAPLVINGLYAVADAASGGGWHASHHKLILS